MVILECDSFHVFVVSSDAIVVLCDIPVCLTGVALLVTAMVKFRRVSVEWIEQRWWSWREAFGQTPMLLPHA